MFTNKRIALKRAAWAAALALASVSTHAIAADKALLIGVGKFTYLEGNDLPGIDLDVKMMEGVAQRLGYTQITKLENQDATKKAILDRFERLLVSEANPEDRVLIYFSGHGTGLADDNGDEDDGQDEALLASDTRVGQTPDGTPTLGGVVLDDDIGALIARARVKSVTLIVDSCHSGTMDKALVFNRPVMGNKVGIKKMFVWPGARSGNNKGFAMPKSFGVAKRGPTSPATPTTSYLSLTAAGDDQAARATNSGSMFTVGITQAISAASADGVITPRQLVAAAEKYIAGETSPAERFKPEIHGSPDMIDAPIRLTNTNTGDGPNWKQVVQIAAQLPTIPTTGFQSQYKDGQELQFTLDLPSDGYLNVIAVGADDSVTLLYPNHLEQSNSVKAGRFTLPGDVPAKNGQQLYFPVTSPYGKTMVLAVLSKQEKNLYTSATDANANDGLRTPSFAAIGDLIKAGEKTRSFKADTKAVGTPTPDIWAVKAEMLTCRASGC